MEQYDNRIDAYIDKAPAFAQPVLIHFRQLVHQTVPLITETIKWGMPFFEYKGQVCYMAAFKQHCAIGFWKQGRLKDPYGVITQGEESSAGSVGRLTSPADLPGDKILVDFIKQIIALNETGEKPVVKKPATPKAEIPMPDDLAALLEEHPKARATFIAFSPSNKREYLEWITEAKTEATRKKRIETAIEWMTEGKSRNWKYK